VHADIKSKGPCPCHYYATVRSRTYILKTAARRVAVVRTRPTARALALAGHERRGEKTKEAAPSPSPKSRRSSGRSTYAAVTGARREGAQRRLQLVVYGSDGRVCCALAQKLGFLIMVSRSKLVDRSASAANAINGGGT